MYVQKNFAVVSAAALAFLVSSQSASAECGVASYYWQGKVTANGERYNPDGVSAAHKTLPFGSRVLVRNQRNGRTIVVRINDRGPYIRGRIIDLSRGANRIFGMDGIAPVCISVLSYGNGRYVGRSTGTWRAASSRRKSVTLASLEERRRTRLARRQANRIARGQIRAERTASLRRGKLRSAGVSAQRRTRMSLLRVKKPASVRRLAGAASRRAIRG
ncbi:MAG: septal ring lytic transglycosylase RlpA family protein [Hyphomicrobiales bacterium]|nr:septal ring lytic transglycosylase RlpA family protein [Hyphomicrobiales bacterium]